MKGRSETSLCRAATGMIERKAFLQITKALVLGMRNSLTDPSSCTKQNIIEELAAVLGVERCVIFKVCREEVDGTLREFCEIAAGVPLEEYGPDSRVTSPLDAHPDIEGAVRNGKVLVITHPSTDGRTAYFRGIIETKGISEIAYIPLFIEGDSRAAGASSSTRCTEGRSARTRSTFARRRPSFWGCFSGRKGPCSSFSGMRSSTR